MIGKRSGGQPIWQWLLFPIRRRGRGKVARPKEVDSVPSAPTNFLPGKAIAAPVKFHSNWHCQDGSVPSQFSRLLYKRLRHGFAALARRPVFDAKSRHRKFPETHSAR